MKIKADKVRDVSSGGSLSVGELSIKDGGKLIDMILDNAYSDPYGATVREIGQNASEVDPDFRIHLPTSIEPWFSVIDDGTGMSREDTIDRAFGLGSSTKDGSDDSVGGFGIGMKVPFTISDQYNVISRYHGRMYTFSAYKNDVGRACFSLLADTPTNLPDGLEVRVPVSPEHHNKIRAAVAEQLRFFDPKPRTNVEIDWPDDPVMTGDEWELYTDRQAGVVMGNLWYPVSQFPKDDARNGLFVRLPIGSVTLPMSRESIVYDERSTKVLREAFTRAGEEIDRRIQSEALHKKTAVEVMEFLYAANSRAEIDWCGYKINRHRVSELGSAIVSHRTIRGRFSPKSHETSMFYERPDAVVLGTDFRGRTIPYQDWHDKSGYDRVFVDLNQPPLDWSTLVGPDVPVLRLEDVAPRRSGGKSGRLPAGVKDMQGRRVSTPGPGLYVQTFRGESERFGDLRILERDATNLGLLRPGEGMYQIPRHLKTTALDKAGCREFGAELDKLIAGFDIKFWGRRYRLRRDLRMGVLEKLDTPLHRELKRLNTEAESRPEDERKKWNVLSQYVSVPRTDEFFKKYPLLKSINAYSARVEDLQHYINLIEKELKS